jgi:hypothetical protein
VGCVRLLFVATRLDGFDRLPALAAPLVREWDDCVRERRRVSVRMGEILRELARLGVLPDLRSTTVVDFGNRHGLSPSESLRFADVGLAVERVPALAEKVRAGDVSVQTAGDLGRLARHEDPAAMPAWVERAAVTPPPDMRTQVNRRIEELKTERTVVSMTFHVPEETRRNFARARDLACKEAGTILTDGQTLTALVEDYLDRHDPARVKARPRRMARTEGRPGRGRAAEVVREVLARTEGRCGFPGCVNRKWVQMAHDVPKRDGGSQETDNTWGLCLPHHVAYDRGDFTIRRTPDGPEFYDRRGRRIAPTGRIVEGDDARGGGGGERAPP